MIIKIYIQTSFTVVISFVFSAWIINEFEKICSLVGLCSNVTADDGPQALNAVLLFCSLLRISGIDLANESDSCTTNTCNGELFSRHRLLCLHYELIGIYGLSWGARLLACGTSFLLSSIWTSSVRLKITYGYYPYDLAVRSLSACGPSHKIGRLRHRGVI